MGLATIALHPYSYHHTIVTVEPRFTHYYYLCKHKQRDCIRWFGYKPIASFQHQCQLKWYWYSINIHALNFAVLFGSQNLQHKGHMNIKGFTVLKRTDVMLWDTLPLIINHRHPPFCDSQSVRGNHPHLFSTAW